MKRRRNPFRIKRYLPALALLGVAAVAVLEAPKLGLGSLVPSPGGSHPTVSGPFGDIASMRKQNPNFDSQLATWQSERSSRAQDPWSWPDFRTHEMGIGAPDPGALAPAQFFGLPV